MYRESESNPSLERLSALMDGESDERETLEACGGWRDDEEARRQWHAWHVIGDALRSDDLVVGRTEGDASFLAALRTRLADEPVVMAPTPLENPHERVPVVAAVAPVASRRLRRSAGGAAAIAAGFVVVAGTLVALRPMGESGDSRVARQQAAPLVPTAVPVAAVATLKSVEPQSLVVNGKLIRDARLDQYLAAHKQYSPLGMPTALTQGRLVETTASAR